MNKMTIAVIALLLPLLLASCDTLENGLEIPQETPISTPTRPSGDETAEAPTPPPSPIPTMPPTPSADVEPPQAYDGRPAALHITFVHNGRVWLWRQGEQAFALGALDAVANVRISDDGTIIAFERDGELWMIRSDGSDERLLVSAADIAAVEPRLPDLSAALYRYDWVPGTHVVAYNTRLEMEIGLMLNDDLHMIDADTMERTTPLAAGEGGEFTFSPNGLQIAVTTPEMISLLDVDGGNRRQVLSYMPVSTASEFQFYAQPTWAANSSALMVAIPPADPFADPMPPTVLWRIPTDGASALQVGEVQADLGSMFAFAPDLSQMAYTQLPAGSMPGGQQVLMTASLEPTIGEPEMYSTAAHGLQGWSPDGQRFAFLTGLQTPRMMIGQIGSDAQPVQTEQDRATIGMVWVDGTHYLYLMQSDQGWDLHLGEIGYVSTLIASVPNSPPSFDFTR